MFSMYSRGRNRAVAAIKKWKVLRGDLVEVTAGREKGKQGTVSRVIRDKNQVVVEGLNLVKRHVRSTKERQGGIVTLEAPMHVSNVQVVDPVTGKPSRVGFRFLEDGSKVRVATRSGAVIPRPVVHTEKRIRAEGENNTADQHVAQKVTFSLEDELQYISELTGKSVDDLRASVESHQQKRAEDNKA